MFVVVNTKILRSTINAGTALSMIFGIALYINCLYNGTGTYFINVAFNPSLDTAVAETYIDILKNCIIPIKTHTVIVLYIFPFNKLLNSNLVSSPFPAKKNIASISIGIINAGRTHCVKNIGFLISILNSFFT